MGATVWAMGHMGAVTNRCLTRLSFIQTLHGFVPGSLHNLTKLPTQKW